MNEIMDFIYNFINTNLASLGSYAPIFACLLILVESILPVLPLFVFITINFLAFGNLIGFLISWIFAICGSMIAYFLVKKFTNKIMTKIMEKHQNINKIASDINKLTLMQLAVTLAMPFTPAFAVNIAAGATKIETKKYFLSLCIGKLFLVYFWGFIGTSLVESLKNPLILIKIGIMLIIAYIISVIVNKVFKLK